jgi:nitrous oxidase accessory protein
MTLLAALCLVLAGGDTLRLGPGVHPGPLVIDHPTVVLGAPGAVVRGSGRGSVIVISAPGVVIRGLRIEHSGRDLDHDDAGILVLADSAILTDLVIRDILHGVYLRQVRGVRLERLDIAGPRGLPEGESGNGIHFYSSRDIRVRDARIADVRDGMYISFSDSVAVDKSRVSRVRFGLHFMYSNDDRFTRNIFTDNAAGAAIMYSRRLFVAGNIFAWNAGVRSYGVILQTAEAPVLEGNVFVGNGTGLLFDNVRQGRVTHNLVAGNWLGLELLGSSDATVITGNSLLANTFDASGGATPGAYALCRDGRGNYWGAAAGDGYDLDGDGVLDVPHAAAAPLAELALTHEGLRPLLDSPAARAMAWAERTFPVFATAGAVDSCPLARAPRLAAVADLPPAPLARLGGRGPQQVAGAALFLGGLVGLGGFTRRRRRGRAT